MSLNETDVRSRRAILGAAAGAAAATAIGVLARPLAVEANTGDPVVAGQTVTATSPTQIHCTNNNDAIAAITDDATTKSGVFAYATAATGANFGAYCRSNSSAGTGVEGIATSATGITRGVHGVTASTTALAVGVLGEATATSGATAGVWGSGFSPAGAGVVGASAVGLATLSWGKAAFSRSGIASVPKSKTFVDINLSTLGGITAKTAIHATMQSYAAGVAVACVRPNYPSAGKARIYLTKVASTSKSTAVAWIATEVWP